MEPPAQEAAPQAAAAPKQEEGEGLMQQAPPPPPEAAPAPTSVDSSTSTNPARTPSPSSTATAEGAAAAVAATGAASSSTPVPSQAPGVGGGVVEDQLSKFKRLLTLSRQRLEENQKALAEKDGALSRLSKEGEALRARVAQLQQQVQQQGQGNGNNGGVPGGKVARRALLRVDVGTRVWLLLEPEEGPGAAAVVGREGDGDYWQAFSSEADAAAFLAPTGRPPLPPGSLAALPPCLSPFESATVQAEARASVEKAKEELRRYRVRHEMLLRGKEAEIKQLSASALAQQTQRIDGAGTQDSEELQRQVKAQAEKIAALRQELAETEQRWRAACEKAVREKEALLEGAGAGGAAAADTALASQWRKRYESVVREKEDLRSRLDLSGSGPLTEQKYQELKDEYRLYRKQALAALREKDAAIASLGGTPTTITTSAPTPSSNGGGAGGLNLQDPSVVYLRNLCEKFFSTESPEIREHTERAMCTVLRFSDEEMRRMREARGAVSISGAAASASSGIGEWATSLFGAAASTPAGGSGGSR